MTQIIMGPGGSGCFGTKLAPVPRMLNEATTLTCGLRIRGAASSSPTRLPTKYEYFRREPRGACGLTTTL